MPEEGSYGLMPYKEIVGLKKQIAELKQKSGEAPSRELLRSMNELTKSMDSMLQLFKSAVEELKLEEKGEETVSKKVGPLMDKLDKIIDQNKTIAEGMVAVADTVKEVKGGEPIEGRPEPSFKPPEHPGMHPLETEPPLKVERIELRGPMEKRPGPVPRAPPFPPPQGMPPSPPPGLGPMPPPGMPPGPMPGPPAGPIPGPAEMPPLGPMPGPPGPMPGEPKKKGLFGLFKKK